MANSITYLGKTYNENEIVSGSFSRKQSLSMSELSVDTMEITVRPYLHLEFFTHEPLPMYTRDKLRFQTSEANPFVEQFQQNTPVVQYADGAQTAIWYLQSVDRMGKNIYKMSGFSSLGRLTQITHYGGIYNGVAAETIIADIMGNIPYYIDNVFRGVLVYGWLPIATARDNLQQVLFAINANLSTAADGTIRVENLSTAPTAYITESDIFQSNANVKYNTPVTKVVVLEHQFVAGSETKQLFNGTATGNQIVTFDEPMSNLTGSSGLTIVSSGANFAVVSGTGTLTGTPYIHMTREISKDVASASVPNIVRVESATLIGITASADVVNRLSQYYACRNSINIAVSMAFLGAGAVVNAFDPYDEVMRLACVESEQTALSASPKSTISALVGFSPWQVVEFEDVRVVLTDTGTWIPPEGVTQLTGVLIDKGLDGEAGDDGTQGTKNSYSGRIDKYNYTISFSAGVPGKGGAGGKAGDGGRVLRVEIPVEQGDSFSYSVGETTTFGSFSSAFGSRLAAGYTDPVTGDVYALPGTDGINGGDGGAGGSGNSGSAADGAAGGSTENYTGGLGGKGSYSSADIGTDVGTTSQGGAGGGGASGNANGGNANGYVCGNGASAVQPAAKTDYGCGGDGGNGGGGSGAGGSTYWHYQRRNMAPSYINYTYDIYTVGTPGSGAPGGFGAPGCIILYYRRPVSQ